MTILEDKIKNIEENTMWNLIKKKGYKTLTDFADDVGICKGFASQLVHKKANPSIETYRKIEDILGEEVRSHFF